MEQNFAALQPKPESAPPISSLDGACCWGNPYEGAKDGKKRCKKLIIIIIILIIIIVIIIKIIKIISEGLVQRI
jgi:hypothetical protein